MNEEALVYSFNLFSNNGYNGTIDDYKALLGSNQEALNTSYQLFTSGGYNGTIEDYSALLGVGKPMGVAEVGAAVTPTGEAPESTESELVDGSSASLDARIRAADPFNVTGFDDEPEPEFGSLGLVTPQSRPFEEKVDDYQKKVQDYFSGNGIYSFINQTGETPTTDGMLKYIERDQIYKKFGKLDIEDSETPVLKSDSSGRYGMVISPEVYDYVETFFPDQYDLYNTEQEYNEALNRAQNQALKNDPILNSTLEAIMKNKSTDLKSYQAELQEKYDINTPEGYEAANKDLNDYITKEVLVPFEQTQLFQDVSNIYKKVGQDVFAEKNINFRRAKDTFLQDDPYAFTEGLVKGWLQMKTGFKQADISRFHGEIGENTEELQRLYNENPNAETSWGTQTRIDKTGKQVKFGTKTGTVQERIDMLEKDNDKLAEKLVKKVGRVGELEERLEVFRQPDQSLSLENIFLSIGEGLPQIAAAAGSGLVSAGAGLALIYAQEYGNNYYSALTQGIEEDKERFPEGATPENIITAINEGLYANRAESLASGAVQTALERVGATTVMKNFTKSIGLGTDLERNLRSLYKGEVKDLIKYAPSSIKRIAVGGGGEALTEAGQSLVGQASTAIQLDKPISTYYDAEEIKQAAFQGGTLGSFLPLAGATTSQVQVELRAAARDVALKFNTKNAQQYRAIDTFFETAETNLKSRKERGEITEDEYRRESQALANAKNTGAKIPQHFDDEAKQRSFDLMIQRDVLQREVNESDPSLVEDEVSQIATINEELKTIAREQAPRKAAEKIRKGVAKTSEKLDYKFEPQETQEQYDARAKQLEDEGFKVQKSVVYGESLVKQNEDGTLEEVILINDQKAKEDNVYTTDQHELLHPIFRNTFSKNPQAAAAFGISLLNELGNNKNVKINSPEVQARLIEYLSDGVPTVEALEEVMNFTSEALTNGSIVVQENVLKRIGNTITKLLQDVGLFSIKFNTGKDVLSFIKGYNETLGKGKALSRAQRKVATKGAQGLLAVATEDTTPTIEDEIIRQVVETAEPTQETTSQASRPISPRAQQFIEQVEEDILTNENLVQIINSPSSTSDDKFAAIDAVVENNWPVISNSIKFDPTGNIPMDAVKEAVTEQIQGIFPEVTLPSGAKVDRTNKPLFKDFDATRNNKVTTILGPKFLGRRQAEILERAKIIGARTQGVDLSEAKGIAAEKTKKPTDQPIRAKLIDSRKFGPAANVNIDDVVVVKKGARPSFRELAEQNLDEVSTLVFDVPGNKIRGKATLTDAEAKSLQRLFVDPNNIRKLIRTMPPYNVAGSETVISEQREAIDVSRDIKGKSIGLSNKFMKKYYQPVDRAIPGISNASGRSLGLTSQTQVYELKPEYTGRITNEIVKQVQDDVGVTERGVPNQKISAENRSKYGTTLTGFAKMYLANAINAAGRGKQTTKQEKADTGAGKAKTAASKPMPKKPSPELQEKLDAVSQAVDINEAAKLAGIKGKVTVNDDNREQKQAEMEQAIIKAKIPSSMFEQSRFGNFGTAYEPGKIVDGKFVKDSKSKEKYFILTKPINGKLYLKRPKTSTERKKLYAKYPGYFKAGRNALYYNNQDPAYQAALALARKNDSLYDVKPAKRVTVNKAFTEKGQEQGQVNMDALEFMANRLTEAVANNEMPVEIAALFVASGYQSSNGIVKIAAPFRYKSKVMKYGTARNQSQGEKFREEHNPPASVIGANLIYGIANNNMGVIFPAIRKNYYQTQLSKADDQKIDEADLDKVMPVGHSILNNSAARIIAAGIDTNSLVNPITGETLAQELGVVLDKVNVNDNNVTKQNQLLMEVLAGTKSKAEAQGYLNDYVEIKSITKASKVSNTKLPSGIALDDPARFDRFDMVDVVTRTMYPRTQFDLYPYESLTVDEKISVLKELPGLQVTEEGINPAKSPYFSKASRLKQNTKVINLMDQADQAVDNARNVNAPNKGISVWDFDDTLATTKSNVLYTMPDGTEGVLNAEQFAKRGEELLNEGAQFDFSEFEKVTKGAKGPMFEKAVARNKKFGNENVFILTARTQAAAEPIHKFLKAIGLDIPLQNIIGLGNSTPEAKAQWVVGKAAEGYNDFYFADDAYKNVKAVQDALNVLDVKSKVRQAYVATSKPSKLNKDFNKILEQTTGVAAEKEYSRAKAQVVGAARGRVFRGIPYSAQDLVGLLYETLGKGEIGDAQMAWWKKHLIDPYARAMNDLDNARLAVMQDYRAIKKQLGVVPKDLRAKVPGEPFSKEQAIRVYIWNKQGMDIPGLSKSDLQSLTEYVEKNSELQLFADQLIAIHKGDEYAKPGNGWVVGTITTDILEGINGVKRPKYLQQWQENADVIFSEANLNKLEALYGKPYRKAMENMLKRMKTGRNRNFSDDSLTGRFTDWLQGSIGTIMFFNTRSSLLQTISAINFINFTDNNPLAAARAFGNQKQYWSDFITLINSDFLKARRSGLRMNVSEADIADMARQGGPRAVISRLLQLGFAPTQIADSFAIASGGATFYRNRIKSLMKQGMSKSEAEAQAFQDFRENAEESQQSSRPDRISMQQAGPLGRLILAFANTPAQYARLTDKAIRDLKIGRGDAKTNISKILYYTTVQNLIFNALQQAIFALAFDDEEPEDKKKKDKYFDIANGMADSLLRGAGFAGAAVSVGKNAIIRIIDESKKKQPKFEKVGYELTRISPPISAKLSRINQAARAYQWEKDEMINGGWGLDNPAYLAVGNVISALTNVPIDRGVKKINNVTKATESDLETWERLALLGGWQDWEIGLNEETKKNKPQPRKRKTRSKERKTTVR